LNFHSLSLAMSVAMAIHAEGDAVAHVETEVGIVLPSLDVVRIESLAGLTAFLAKISVAFVDRRSPRSILEGIEFSQPVRIGGTPIAWMCGSDKVRDSAFHGAESSLEMWRGLHRLSAMLTLGIYPLPLRLR
jgi:hypothetical protein